MNAWDPSIDLKISQAQRAGHFDDLPGLGQPIPDLDEGWDETRWLREKLKAEDLRVMPPAWAIRAWARQEAANLLAIDDEGVLRQRIEAFNAELLKRMRGALWGPPVDVAPIDAETLIAKRRESRAARLPSAPAS
ncbi:MAG TPA: DnaJ family domain-containing protein [Pirellulaceae bacterium]|jgi:hypothetical protein|nr:DnaJ family domain-containing protein [Pirellulaceae bacterium]